MTKQSTARRKTLLPLFLLFFLSVSGAAPAAEYETVRAARFSSADLGKAVPQGWSLDRKLGTSNLRLEKAGSAFVVRLISDGNSSFGIKREFQVDLREFPFLNWRWKAVRLPRGGDVRQAATDDQAIQLYVAFTATGFPAALNTPAIGYLWDNEAPRGWTGRSEQAGGGKIRYMVLRNKADPVGEWQTESRNIQQDFRRLFQDLGGADAVTCGIQFHINSQYTRSEAEGCIGDLFFSRQQIRGAAAPAPFAGVR